MMIEPDKDAAIHSHAVVNCPLKEFALVRAIGCKSCKFYSGIIHVGDQGDWAKQNRLVCGHPTARQILMFEG